MNANVITLIVCLIILAVLIYLFCILTKGIFYHIIGAFKASKSLLSKNGADKAYDILSNSVEYGYIPDSAISEAIGVMIDKGATDEEIIQFINFSSRQIGYDAERALRKLESKEFREKLSKYIDLL